MSNEYKRIAEIQISMFIRAVFSLGNFYIVVPTDQSRWTVSPPEENIKAGVMRLNIAGWSRENTDTDDEGIHVTIAFGDIEASAYYRYCEILEIGDDTGGPLFRRVFIHEEENIPNFTLKGVMDDAQKKSMDIMRKNNPKM